MAQKSLLKIIQTACAELALPQPNAALGSSEKSVLKLVAFVRATCDVLLSEYDWQELTTQYELATKPGRASYPFPADSDRFVSGTIFDSGSRWELTGALTSRQWARLRTNNAITQPYTQYKIEGNQIHLIPTPENSSTITYEYISSNYVIDPATGQTKSDFEIDSDVCLFDYRTVVFGVKYRWLASIGQDTTAALIDYKRAYEMAKGHNRVAMNLDLRGHTGSLHLIDNNNYTDGGWGL